LQPAFRKLALPQKLQIYNPGRTQSFIATMKSHHNSTQFINRVKKKHKNKALPERLPH
jgi:hypothetical protein